MKKCDGADMITGNIHSIETLGTLDGPGIRMVVFLQGCKLRCIYCHNPDTWNEHSNNKIAMTPEYIVHKAIKYKPYFKNNDGGITFSGGEPLLQPEFLLECLRGCQREGIHAVIDTCGVGLGDYDEILKYTNLVILDIKHSNPKMYKNITGIDIKYYYEFKEAIIKNKKDIWIKHVVTPGINDSCEDMKAFEKEVNSFPQDIIQKVELLPYHTLGVFKYKELGIKYKLENIPPLSNDKLNELKGLCRLRQI